MPGPALPHPGTCTLREDGDLTLLAPSPGGLGVEEVAGCVGAQSPTGCKMPLAAGCGLGHDPPCPAGMRKIARLRGSRLGFLE